MQINLMKGGGEMKKPTYTVLSALLLPVSFILFSKYIELMSILKTGVDGGGIGIYLLGFEINDSVMTHQISTYAYGFLIVSILLFAPILYNLYKAIKVKSA